MQSKNYDPENSTSVLILVYSTRLSEAQTSCSVSNERIINEQQIVKDLERGGRGLV
jgi:hypothetical protein